MILFFSDSKTITLCVHITGSGEVTSTVIKLEEGVLAVGAAGRQHVVALYGDSEAQLGMVRARLDVICGYFSQTFEQLYS